MTEKLLPGMTTAEVAALLGVHTSTVRRYADAGLIRAAETPGGHRRYDRASVERVLATMTND